MSNSQGKPSDGPTADVSAEIIQAALDSVERTAFASRAADDPQASTEAPTVELLERELREVRATLDLSVERARDTLDRLKETHERHLRAAADLENYKKRAAREREEAERFGIQKLLKDLLPILDNLDRALTHGWPDNPLAEGVAATRRLFQDTLSRYGIKAFGAAGDVFDPTRHEAMQQVETSQTPPGTVVSELVRGYMLHDRLLRPALVAVAVAPQNPPSPSGGSGE